MGSRFTIKNHRQESQLFNVRAIVILIGVLIFSAVIIGRLFYLQIIEKSFYQTLSEHNIINLVPISPKRGLIYDRNGVLLATNIPVYSLSLIPGRIKNMRNTLARLQNIIIITPEELKAFHHNYNPFHRFQPITLIPRLTEEQAAKFYVNSYAFPGVIIEPHLLRQYPLGAPLGNAVGYVARITAKELKTVNAENYMASGYMGKTGIEKQYENILHGTIGYEEVEINAAGQFVRVLKENPAIPGKDIKITIDSRLQQFAQQALGDLSGAIVAIEPSTGQVLAMVTNPGYDPNPFVTGISEKDYSELLHAPKHPLYDRVIRGLYSPGSTIKPFYAVGGLDNGTITENTTVYDPGWFKAPGTKHVFHDWKLTGHGYVNVSKAIAVSCDFFFWNLAINMGIEKMDAIMREFGFGELTGIDLPNELAGVVPSPEWKRMAKGVAWYPGDTVNAGIGQGQVLVTPMQLAVATATLANRGMRLKPHLLMDQPIESKTAIILERFSIWQYVYEAMQNVVKSVYGSSVKFGRDSSYSVAAKTGTAQVHSKSRDEVSEDSSLPEKLRNNHLFIAFAPIDHPKIAIAVIVEHSANADKIARQILDFYLLPATTTVIPWLDRGIQDLSAKSGSRAFARDDNGVGNYATKPQQ